MKRALAVDFDDLLYPFMSVLVPFHNERYGTDMTIDDYLTFNFEDLWGNTRAEAMDRVDKCFDDLDALDKHPGPISGADVALPKLADFYDLYVVTARHDELHERTTTWLEHHFPGVFADVFLCNSYMEDGRHTKRTKLSVVTEIDAVALVDDSLSNVRSVAAAGRLGVLFGDYAWNRADELPPGVARAKDWDEVVHMLVPA